MAKLQIKKGDTVVVISGKDKGKQGTVIATEPAKERVFVEGVNTVKRHTKPSQGRLCGEKSHSRRQKVLSAESH